MSRSSRHGEICAGCGDVVTDTYTIHQGLRSCNLGSDTFVHDRRTLMLPPIRDTGLCSYCQMEREYYEQPSLKDVPQNSAALELYELDWSTEEYLQRLQNPLEDITRSKEIVIRRQQYEIEKQRREGLPVLWELSDQYTCDCLQSGFRFHRQKTVDCIRCALAAAGNQGEELEDKTWIYAVQNEVVVASKALKIYLEPLIREHIQDAKEFKASLEKKHRSERVGILNREERKVKRRQHRLEFISSAEVAGLRNLEEELELAESLEQQEQAGDDEQCQPVRQMLRWETFREHFCDFEPDPNARRGLRRHSQDVLDHGSFIRITGPGPKDPAWSPRNTSGCIRQSLTSSCASPDS